MPMQPIRLLLILAATVGLAGCEFLFSAACVDQKQTRMDCSTENPPVARKATALDPAVLNGASAATGERT